MTSRSRYFLVSAAAILVAGIGGGLIAYYQYKGLPMAASGLPAELRYVPASADVVAYADVRAVMSSELRRELERVALGSRRGRRDMNDFAGIDLEKQVHHIVAYLEPAKGSSGAEPAPEGAREGPRGLIFLQGTFDQPRVEQFVREHGGVIEAYHGKNIMIHRNPEDSGRGDQPNMEMAIGFLRPDLMSLGQADLVRVALDRPDSASPAGGDVTGNAGLMNLIRDAAGETAWVVGRFDTASRRMGIPPSVRQQIPPLEFMSAKAHINGGVKATIRAETADQTAADQMRDVLRGFVSLIRLQAGSKPELQNALKTLELSGTGSTVQVAFALTPETLRAMMPSPRRGPPDPR